MIEPALRDEAFLQNVREAQSIRSSFHLWWLGQSGFLVQWQGAHLLLDPYLSDSLTRKYANTDKPHVRMTARVIAPDRLDFINLVTSSHQHTDHFDPETLQPLLRLNPQLKLVVPEANRTAAAARLDVPPETLTGLDAGQSVSAAGFTLTAVPAAHETVEKDELGQCKFLGYVVEFGPWTIYHSGDTVPCDGMIALLSRWKIDLALLPINGRHHARRVAGNLDGPEAATLAKAVGARLVIPCHYEMFEFNTASPDQFVRAAESLRQPCRLLRAGERWTSAELGLKPFKTKRLALVPQTREEVRAEIERMRPEDKTEVSPAWLALLDNSSPLDPWVHGFRIVHQASQIVIGQCGFKGPPDADGTVEIAYGIAPEHQGQGYATEAAEALTRYAFEDPHVHIVRSHTRPEQNASTRVLAKCGFQWIGEVVDPDDGLVWRWEKQRADSRP